MKYDDLLKKEDIRDFTYSTHEPSVYNFDLFLRSKTADKYMIIRKTLVLEMYEAAIDKLEDKWSEELESLGIK